MITNTINFFTVISENEGFGINTDIFESPAGLPCIRWMPKSMLVSEKRVIRNVIAYFLSITLNVKIRRIARQYSIMKINCLKYSFIVK